MSTGETSQNSFEQRSERAEFHVMPPSETADARAWPPSGAKAGAADMICRDIPQESRLYWTAHVSTHRTSAFTQPAQAASIDELFGNLENTHHLKRALELLGESITLVESALALDVTEPVACDDQMQLFYALLPALFCCRSLGDGFGSIINGIQQAVANQKGFPMDRKQMGVLRSVLRSIRQGPFISHRDAVEIVMSLEDTGLMVDPPALAEIADTPQYDQAGLR
jgi:hypothetical protein